MSRRGAAETAPAGGSFVLRLALGVALLLVVVSCSRASSGPSAAPSTATTATTTTTAPPIVIFFEIGSWHWDSPEQMSSARAEAADIRGKESLRILMPTKAPAGGRIISGNLRITQATPTGEVNASVAVTIDLAGSKLISSVQSSPAEDALSCGERTDGE